jgi:hypothetical protein
MILAEYDSEVLPLGRWQRKTTANGRGQLNLDKIDRNRTAKAKITRSTMR